MSILIRILVAVVAVFLALALVGPVLTAVGFPLTANGMVIFRLVTAGLAVFYILLGGPIR